MLAAIESQANHAGRCKLNEVMREGLIVSDPRVLDGKACVRGTRLSVESLLELATSLESPEGLH